MRILHVCAVGFTVKNLLLPQIQYFLDQGLEIEIACSPSEEVTDLQSQGYVIHPVNIERKISPISNLRSVAALTQLMMRQDYDLVHVHTPIASVLGRVAAKLARVPRVIYTAHGFYFHDNMPPNQYRFYHRIERVSGWLTDVILTQSKEDLETAKRTNLCSPKKLFYLGNGINLNRFDRSQLIEEQQEKLRGNLQIPDTASPVLGMTGRITQEKGYVELIEALELLRHHFPNVHLVVIGGQLSSERDLFQAQLKKIIQTKRLDKHITFTGFRSDIPELLGLVDVFVLPSYREGLPRSVLEAMAMGVPVVTTDIRGCREAVKHQSTGLIVPPQDYQELATAIRTILENPDLRKIFGAASLVRVREQFDERLVFQRLHSVYQELGVLV